MPARIGFPTDHEPTIVVRPALGRYDDFAAVVGPTSGCARLLVHVLSRQFGTGTGPA